MVQLNALNRERNIQKEVFSQQTGVSLIRTDQDLTSTAGDSVMERADRQLLIFGSTENGTREALHRTELFAVCSFVQLNQK